MYEITNCLQKHVSLLFKQNNILSHFTVSHCITLHFEVHFNIIPCVIISQVIYTLSDCPTHMWCSVLLNCFYSLAEEDTRF
jgi:hypothetical protein